MFRFLTLFFVLYYAITLIEQHSLIKKYIANKEIIKFINKSNKGESVDKLIEDNLKLVIKFIIASILYLTLMLVEFIYIVFAFNYGNAYIVFAYALFWIILFAYVKFKNKDKLLDENEDYKKYSINQMVLNLVDLAFFMYMAVILFL